MSDPDSSFLSRWSRRKVQVRERVALADAPAAEPPQPATADAAAGAPPVLPVTQPPLAAPAAETAVAPCAPTLTDVAALSPQSDYTRFLAQGVSPEVKNAALKKLFTDPHFNVMDGLDTYIDDYGKPDPLPAGMLRKMAQSQLLGLFADEDKAEAAEGPRPTAAAAPAAAAVAESPGPDLALDAQGAPRAAADLAAERPGHADDAAPH
jgi:hypothetical protein